MQPEERYLAVSILSKLAYGIGCLCLYLIALVIFGSSVINVIKELLLTEFSVYKILDEVGLLVFSIAVVDVSKFLMVEEVLKAKGRSQKEERHAFSRFIIIILTALSLEGLVLTIETAKTDLAKVVYPILLFVIVTVLIVSLGIYQKLNAAADDDRK